MAGPRSTGTGNRPQRAPGLRLLFGGDVMLGRMVDGILEREGADYPFSGLSGIREGADLFLVNLECAISARPLRYRGPAKAFYFRARPIAATALARVGVDLVSLANNHALDANGEGLLDTLDILARHGIATAGAGTSLKAAGRVAVLKCRGRSVGVLACCDHQPDFAATGQRPGINYLNLVDSSVRQSLVERVRRAADQVDHLVVSLHWMPNWVDTIPSGLRELASHLVAAGARIVWGHSAHHILGTEWLGTSVVLYSCGDLLDDYAVDPDYRNDRQLLYEIDLDRNAVHSVHAWPVQLTPGRTRPATGAARAWIARRAKQACAAVGSELTDSGRGFFEIAAVEQRA
ncbi:MAG: CapA family protein [Gammaproteobacteria bacterium]|jgi:poly-gamma-glutamate synthesis protein (capsule biosynthesis protein)